MEENNIQESNEISTVEQNNAVLENNQPVSEAVVANSGVQAVDDVSSANVESTSAVDTTLPTEFASADNVVATEPVTTEVTGTPIKPKKKVNKTLIVVLIFVIVFGGAMLLMNQGSKSSNNNNKKEEEKEEIKVNVGSDWGNKYLTYMFEEKPDLKTYEISFIDVDDDEIPEMFLKYIDNSDKESMKILFIADDGYVYESKYYRDYKIRYIYSLKDKTTQWYLYLTTTKQYGTYTMISKIIDDMAFDADIKATNDSLLIEYGKKYYDTDYQPVFYTIKENSTEDDFRDFVSKYEGYNDKVKEIKNTVENKYKDYQYKDDVKVVQDSVGIAGRIFKYGQYYVYVPADEERNQPEKTLVIVLNEDGTIVVNGILYTYTIDYEESRIVLDDNKFIKLLNGEFNFEGLIFKHSSVFTLPE